ncbi:NUDIX domain-containing protein [Candidatus Wolfebacteria bacterium]|nr:NUDIX domain-containing protein [Candidatus Wolfebacteria bacterium]
MENRPKVGVGVIVMKDGKVPLGKRRGSHGEGSWCLPGGHLEFGESWEDCAKREVTEESGVTIKNIRFGAATNDIFEEEGKHYITIYMLADWDSGELKITEPEKWDKWDWFEWGKFPEPLFIPLCNLLKQGFDPFK